MMMTNSARPQTESLNAINNSRGFARSERVSVSLPARWFGPVSLSILAAFAHIGGQLLLARAWLIPHDGVFLLTPLFAAAALVFGTINGLIAAKLLAEPAPTEADGLVRR